jgi:uncharacterized protein
MKFTLDARSDVNLIRGYGAGVLRIGERSVERNCIVSADTLIPDWDVQSVAQLSVEDLRAVWPLQPEVVLLGTGARQVFPARDVREAFSQRKVALETMDLGAACRTYNILVQEERRVVALFFLS